MVKRNIVLGIRLLVEDHFCRGWSKYGIFNDCVLRLFPLFVRQRFKLEAVSTEAVAADTFSDPAIRWLERSSVRLIQSVSLPSIVHLQVWRVLLILKDLSPEYLRSLV